jgi:hypothetical protein
MGTPILIVGQTGTGKSTALRNLPREKTAILNAECQPLPFKNSKFALRGEIRTTAQMISAMNRVEKDDKIEIAVIDSINMYLEGPVSKEIVETAIDGFEGWKNYKKHALLIIEKMKASKKKYIVICSEERTEDITKMGIYSAKVQGSLKGGGIESHFVCVFRSMKMDDIEAKNGVSYKFATNQIPGERITAKTPMEMFDDLYIDNDIMEVSKIVEDYFNE